MPLSTRGSRSGRPRTCHGVAGCSQADTLAEEEVHFFVDMLQGLWRHVVVIDQLGDLLGLGLVTAAFAAERILPVPVEAAVGAGVKLVLTCISAWSADPTTRLHNVQQEKARQRLLSLTGCRMAVAHIRGVVGPCAG